MTLDDYSYKEVRTREGMIQIRVTPEEKQAIKKRADALGMPIAPYARRVCMDPQIIHWHYEALDEYRDAVTAIRNAVTHVVYGMRCSGQYKPEEIQEVAGLLKEVAGLSKEILDKVLEESETIDRQARRKNLILPEGSLAEKPEPSGRAEELKRAFDKHTAKASNAYRDLLQNPRDPLKVLMAGYWAGRCRGLGDALGKGPGESRRAQMADMLLARILRSYKLDPDRVMEEKEVK